MNKLINHAQKFSLIMIKPQYSRNTTPTSQLTDQCISQEQHINHILEKYQNIFQDPNGVPLNCQVKHSIELVSGSSLSKASVFKRSILENEEIRRQIQDLINKGHICPNSSTCGIRVVLAPKKEWTWHMCIDYRDLNKISVKNRYPLP